MSQLTEQVRFTTQAGLPEELAGFEGLGLNERHELVGVDEDGNTKRLSRVGEILIHFAKEAGVAEEATPEDISPAAQAIIDRLEQQNQLLKDQLSVAEEKNTDLEGRLVSLENRNREVDGFKIGDAVAQLVDENEDEQEYEQGYEIVGFSDENPDGIIIRDTESDEKTEVPSSNLIHEDELEDEIPEPAPTPPASSLNWRDRASLKVKNAAYSPFTRRVATVTEYDEEGRPINETVERSGMSGLAAGALAIGAVVVFELFEHKIWGHSPSRESRQIAHNHAVEMNAINIHEHADKARDAAELKAINANHVTEMKAIAHNEHMDFVRAAHAHKHDLSAINGVLKAVNRDHHTLLEHAGYYGTPTSHSGNFSNYQYPWNYTHNETQLHTWASKAAVAGHKVRWIRNGLLPNGNINETLEVDGTTNTSKVLQIITQYK